MLGQQSGGWGGAPAATAGAGFGAFGGGFCGALGGGFGAPAASSSAFGGFGAPATAVSASAFAFTAAPSASAAPFGFASASSAPSGAVFAFSAGGGLFGGLVGVGQVGATAAGLSFGSIAAPVAASGSLFGAVLAAAPAASLFSAPALAPSSSSAGLFGAVPAPAAAPTSPFGAAPAASSAASLFGSPAPAAGGGVFGSAVHAAHTASSATLFSGFSASSGHSSPFPMLAPGLGAPSATLAASSSAGLFAASAASGARLPGTNNQFQPTAGPSVTVSTSAAVQSNRAGFPMKRSGETGLWYCGRLLGCAVIPGSDGRCGPNNGPQCPDCKAGAVNFEVAAPAFGGGAGSTQTPAAFVGFGAPPAPAFAAAQSFAVPAPQTAGGAIVCGSGSFGAPHVGAAAFGPGQTSFAAPAAPAFGQPPSTGTFGSPAQPAGLGAFGSPAQLGTFGGGSGFAAPLFGAAAASFNPGLKTALAKGDDCTVNSICARMKDQSLDSQRFIDYSQGKGSKGVAAVSGQQQQHSVVAPFGTGAEVGISRALGKVRIDVLLLN